MFFPSVKNVWKSPRAKFIFPWILFFASFIVVVNQTEGSFGHKIGHSFTWMIQNGTIYGLFAVGVSIVISTGGVDLSIAGLASFVGVVSAYIFNVTHSLLISFIVAAIIGAIAGRIMGYAITKRNAPPLVFTWARGTLWYILSLVFSKNVKL